MEITIKNTVYYILNNVHPTEIEKQTRHLH
jgi:hypothetical protein